MSELLLDPGLTPNFGAFVDKVDSSTERKRPEGLPSWVEEITLVPGMPDGFFNAAPAGEMLVGRLVDNGAEDGAPDTGQLVGVTIRDGRVVQEPIVLWEPQPAPFPHESAPFLAPPIEDPRAYQAPDGRVTFDLTKLHWNGKEYKPYPAFTDPVSLEELAVGVFPEAHYYDGNDPTSNPEAEPGKNATRITDTHRVFRPDNDNHGLKVFRQKDDGGLEYSQTIRFTKRPEWGEHKMGTTASPFWFAEDDGSRYGIMMVHGMRMEDERYIYAIGASLLEHRVQEDAFSIIGSTRDALLPGHFAGYFSEDVQLHPEIRDAVYMTGASGILEGGVLTGIEGYVNVGDTRTVIARFSVEEILSAAVES